MSMIEQDKMAAAADYERSGIARDASRPISSGMEALDGALDRIANLVGMLEDRIDQILAPSTPTGVEETRLLVVNGDSTVAGYFRQHVRQAEDICERLDRIRGRVEL